MNRIIRARYTNVTDRRKNIYGQRDGQTEGRTTYDSNTALALRASRGKKCFSLRLTVQGRQMYGRGML